MSFLTYENDILATNHVGRQIVKDLDGMPKQCYDPIISSSEFTKGLRLLLKDFSDGLNRATTLELDGKWMSKEVWFSYSSKAD